MAEQKKFVGLLEAIVPGGRSVKVGGQIYDLTEKPRDFLAKSQKRFIPWKTRVEVSLNDEGKISFMQPTDAPATVEAGPNPAAGMSKASSPASSGGGATAPPESSFNVSLWQTCLNCATQIVASSLTDENPKMKAIKILVQADYIYPVSTMKQGGADIVKFVADDALATPVKA